MACLIATSGRIAGGRLAQFWRDEDGTTAIEYAVLASGIACAVAATVYSLGSTLKDNYFQVVLDAATNPTGRSQN